MVEVSTIDVIPMEQRPTATVLQPYMMAYIVDPSMPKGPNLPRRTFKVSLRTLAKFTRPPLSLFTENVTVDGTVAGGIIAEPNHDGMVIMMPSVASRASQSVPLINANPYPLMVAAAPGDQMFLPDATGAIVACSTAILPPRASIELWAIVGNDPADSGWYPRDGYHQPVPKVYSVAGRIGDILLSVADISGLGTAATCSAGMFATPAQLGNAVDSINMSVASHANDKNNPHQVTAAQVGLGNASNTNDADKPVSTATQAALDLKAPASHVADTNNPHGVTKAQVGLGNVDNTADLAKPISTATQAALNGKSNVGHNHAIGDVTNLQPSLDAKLATNGNGSALAGLTKAQVGLGNVDNTSDASKPVSTAQAASIATKAPLIHTHAAADVISGVLDPARLGTGTAGNLTYLRGDGTWAVLPVTQAARVTTSIAGTFTWTFPIPYPTGFIPVIEGLPEAVSGSTDVVNVQLDGPVTNTAAKIRVTRTQQSVATLLGLTVLSVPTSIGATVVHLTARLP